MALLPPPLGCSWEKDRRARFLSQRAGVEMRKRRSGVVEAAVKILVVREVLFVVLLGVVVGQVLLAILFAVVIRQILPAILFAVRVGSGPIVAAAERARAGCAEVMAAAEHGADAVKQQRAAEHPRGGRGRAAEE
jgi:hypothetical protein